MAFARVYEGMGGRESDLDEETTHRRPVPPAAAASTFAHDDEVEGLGRRHVRSRLHSRKRRLRGAPRSWRGRMGCSGRPGSECGGEVSECGGDGVVAMVVNVLMRVVNVVAKVVNVVAAAKGGRRARALPSPGVRFSSRCSSFSGGCR